MTVSITPGVSPTLHAPCVCHDDQVDELRALIRRGVDQFEASRLLWGPAGAVHRAGRDGRTFVRTQLAARMPWLRLPREVS